MKTPISNEVAARDIVTEFAHRAPQRVLDLAFAAIKVGASDSEIEHFADLMRLVEAAAPAMPRRW